MKARRAGEQGQAALYAVLLFPVLTLVLALVLVVGSIEGTRARLRAELDVAALTATQALDVEGLATGGQPRLVEGDTARLARAYLVENLAATPGLLADTPESIAASADIAVTNVGGTDPLTGQVVVAPTVTIRISAPVRIPLLEMVGIGPVVTITVSGSAAART